MVDKTTVTNSLVSESNDPNSGAGESQKEMENRIRENLRGEYNRQSEELSEKLSRAEEEKTELESRINELTASEQKRLSDLTTESNAAKLQLQDLETRPDYAGVREKFKVEGAKVRDEAVDISSHQTSKILMEEFLERKAEEEKVSVKQLRDELNSILKVPGSDNIKYPDLMPHKRIRAAYSERAERKRSQALEDENKRLKAERDGFSEDGGRTPRSTRTNQELREASISGDTRASIELAKNLDARQKEYDSQAV